ncbi:MAG: acyl carrier protein [Christensenellales bacterium]
MFEKIQSLIAEQLYLDKEQITEESKFVDDLGADSLDIVQMLISMEKEFGVSFDDDEITEIKTVKDAIALIEKKK